MSYNILMPDSVLNAAERLTLKDLLDSPAFQAQMVSAMSNCLQNFYARMEAVDERDEFLMFRLEKIYKSIPHETRKACFEEVGRMSRERRERVQNAIR